MDEMKPVKNKGGRPVKASKVSPEKIAEAVLSGGVSRPRIKKDIGLGDDAARLMVKVTGLTIEQFQEIQRTKLQEAADMALEQTKDQLGRANALQAATVYGIFSDKIHRQPNNVTQNLHLHISDGNRGGLLKAILGRAEERVSSCDSVSTTTAPAGPLPTAPAVIDLTPPPKQSAVDS